MKIYSIRLDEDLVARVDGLGVNRSEFIRDAVEAALGAGGDVPKAALVEKRSAPKKNPIVPAVKPLDARREADVKFLLSEIRRLRLTSRQAEALMGWFGMRYRNAENHLLKSGGVVVVDGLLVAI